MPADQLTRAAVADRRAAVIRAAAAGFTLAQIAQTVDGVNSTRQAAQDLHRGLADQMVLRRLDRDQLRELELTSLASVQRAVEGVLRRAAADPGKGDKTVLAASHRLMQIAAHRLQLEGLTHMPAPDAPEDELARRRDRVQQRRRTG
jgi:hypothetical protein